MTVTVPTLEALIEAVEARLPAGMILSLNRGSVVPDAIVGEPIPNDPVYVKGGWRAWVYPAFGTFPAASAGGETLEEALRGLLADLERKS